MNDSTFNPLRPWRHPWRLWRALCYNVTSVPVAGIAFGFTIAFLGATVGLLITFVLALPFAWLTVRAVPRPRAPRAHPDRRARWTCGSPTRCRRSRRPGWLGRLRSGSTSGPRWQEIAHHLAHLPVAVLGVRA